MKNALIPPKKIRERILGGGGGKTLLNAEIRPSTGRKDTSEGKNVTGKNVALYAPIRGNKGIQQKLALGAATALLLLSLAGCAGGDKGTQPPAPSSNQQTESEPEQPAEAPQLDETEAPEPDKFGNMLDPFQGEWKRADIESDVWRLMIDGSQISNVCYDTDGTVLEVKEYEFDLDDAGNLVVTEYGKPRYIYTIDENGQLVSEKNGTGTTTFYEKVSDTANVPDAPEEKLEPAIGMTESEVYASTWGTPKKINRTETAYGVREQWVYDEGYIYLKDGRVTSIQD